MLWGARPTNWESFIWHLTRRRKEIVVDAYSVTSLSPSGEDVWSFDEALVGLPPERRYFHIKQS